MRDPYSAIPAEATPALWRRYDAWRADRHAKFNARYAGTLTGWRNRRSVRRLVLLQIVGLLVIIASSIVAFITYWFFVPFIVGLAVAMGAMIMLRIVTGSIVEAPASALDEIQLAQRNSARSFGYITLYTLMFIPYTVLIVIGGRDQVDGQVVYGAGILLISMLLTGTMVPNMLTSWWIDDPDPEDFETFEEKP